MMTALGVQQECHFLFLSGIRWRGSRSCPRQPTRLSFSMDVFPHGLSVDAPLPRHTSNGQLSRASTKHTSGAEQKCTTREVIGQRKCPRQLFGRSVTEAGWAGE